jgi:hypothetical protein
VKMPRYIFQAATFSLSVAGESGRSGEDRQVVERVNLVTSSRLAARRVGRRDEASRPTTLSKRERPSTPVNHSPATPMNTTLQSDQDYRPVACLDPGISRLSRWPIGAPRVVSAPHLFEG